ncbi:hypothetical protein RchiOBHm_Chr1g0383571 [Rosa chinensis]|uniref:Uncharacterized protein n=1 Tax=Rosa chinensis TaxID=74649 RepID=A0A2P6SPP1_ROSCH|nr:hypothetical protein RchiOBHm_Chr1g0383571 [Rosa chinensis]
MYDTSFTPTSELHCLVPATVNRVWINPTLIVLRSTLPFSSEDLHFIVGFPP